MPLGVVSDADLRKELENSSTDSIDTTPTPSESTATIIDMPGRGRGTGNVAVPDSLRKIIGETSIIEGRTDALALAESLGISPSSVSAYANGATSTASYDTPSNSITNHINERKGKRTSHALKIMKQALTGITSDKLAESKAKELSSIARDMASVVKAMEPEVKESEGIKKPQFVVFAPIMRDESHFEVIQSKE